MYCNEIKMHRKFISSVSFFNEKLKFKCTQYMEPSVSTFEHLIGLIKSPQNTNSFHDDNINKCQSFVFKINRITSSLSQTHTHTHTLPAFYYRDPEQNILTFSYELTPHNHRSNITRTSITLLTNSSGNHP